MRFFKSAAYIILGVLYTIITMKFYGTVLYLISNFDIFNNFSIKDTIILSFDIFILLFFIAVCITCFIKGIQHLYILFRDSFFKKQTDFKQMNIRIDKNNIIRESYMELKNGEIIPIDIKQIILQNEVKQTQQEDENKQESN